MFCQCTDNGGICTGLCVILRCCLYCCERMTKLRDFARFAVVLWECTGNNVWFGIGFWCDLSEYRKRDFVLCFVVFWEMPKKLLLCIASCNDVSVHRKCGILHSLTGLCVMLRWCLYCFERMTKLRDFARFSVVLWECTVNTVWFGIGVRCDLSEYRNRMILHCVLMR